MTPKTKVVRLRQNLEKVARHSIEFFKDTLEHAPPKGKRKFAMRFSVQIEEKGEHGETVGEFRFYQEDDVDGLTVGAPLVGAPTSFCTRP